MIEEGVERDSRGLWNVECAERKTARRPEGKKREKVIISDLPSSLSLYQANNVTLAIEGLQSFLAAASKSAAGLGCATVLLPRGKKDSNLDKSCKGYLNFE